MSNIAPVIRMYRPLRFATSVELRSMDENNYGWLPIDTNPLERICNLCGYRLGLHVVPTYGTWAATPTGLWCPSDARRGDKALPQLPSPLSPEPNPKRGSPPFPEVEAAGGGGNSPDVSNAHSANPQQSGDST